MHIRQRVRDGGHPPDARHLARSCQLWSSRGNVIMARNWAANRRASETRMAETLCIYDQDDPRWANVVLGNDTQPSLAHSGCGIFSFCNAIHALNGLLPDAGASFRATCPENRVALHQQTVYIRILAGVHLAPWSTIPAVVESIIAHS